MQGRGDDIVLSSMTKIRSSALPALPPPGEEQLSTSQRAMRRRPLAYLDALNPERLYCLEIRVLKDSGTLCFSIDRMTKSEIENAINMIFDVVIRLRNKRSNRG